MKEVRDPVHGFIYFNETEMKIVNTRVFQRLRYIRQLAFTHLVYPGAEHSRFAHSMGVMEFATEMFDTLMMKNLARKKKWTVATVKRNRQLLRLGALLHDTGHAPFSHASEELLRGVKHEEVSRRLILADPIAPLINEFKKELGITAEDVASFFSAENIEPDILFLKEIFAGEIDADKLDYLYRDSLFTGVHYGRFDYQRLVQSLCLIEDPDDAGNLIMAIEHGGLHALEAMVLARYFMFTQVYFHKIRRAYDHHLLDFLRKHIEQYPSSLSEYLKYDDNVVFSLLREHLRDDDARRILTRDPFVQAFTTPEHINLEQKTRFSWLRDTLEREFKDVKIFYDAAEASGRLSSIGCLHRRKAGKWSAISAHSFGTITPPARLVPPLIDEGVSNMEKELRAATIVELVQNAPARLGKTQVQKLVYFAQHSGVPLQYKYEIYHYGPYSFELSHELGSLDSLGVLNIQSEPSGYGFDISAGKFADKFKLEPRYQKKIDKVLGDFGSNTPAQLEVKATIHFVLSVIKKKISPSRTKPEVLQKVQALKPRFTPNFLKDCYSDLERTHWI